MGKTTLGNVVKPKPQNIRQSGGDYSNLLGSGRLVAPNPKVYHIHPTPQERSTIHLVTMSL
jgi:hypothetical protein